MPGLSVCIFNSQLKCMTMMRTFTEYDRDSIRSNQF